MISLLPERKAEREGVWERGRGEWAYLGNEMRDKQHSTVD
jgi:hypothetical protein